MRFNPAADSCLFGLIDEAPAYCRPHVAVKFDREVIHVPKQFLRRDTRNLNCCRESAFREEIMHAQYQDEINEGRHLRNTSIEEFETELENLTDSFNQELETMRKAHTEQIKELMERLTAAETNVLPPPPLTSCG